MFVIIQHPSVNISKTINLNSKHIKRETFPILFESSLSGIKKRFNVSGAYKLMQVELSFHPNLLEISVIIQVIRAQTLWTS